ncbi:MAG: hypothetical protein ABIK37_05680, partial [candidate division WOR-3 bacterium]
QNHEWSGMVVTAQSYYRQAEKLAPGRKDVLEALGRVEEAAAWRASLTCVDAADFDGYVQGRYREYRLRLEPRFDDRLRPSGGASWSGNRRGTLGRNYLLCRAGLSFRPISWLELAGQVQGDAFTFAFKAASGRWEAERGRLTWWGDFGRVLYEPAQDIGALTGSTQLALRPGAGFRLSGRAGCVQIIDDGNRKTSLVASAGYDILTRPRLGVQYTLSYDDFRVRSSRYYSPQNLVTHQVGVTLSARRGGTGLSADAAGGVNTVGELVARANAALDQRILPRTSLALEFDYAQTMVRGRYLYASVAVGLSRSL